MSMSKSGAPSADLTSSLHHLRLSSTQLNVLTEKVAATVEEIEQFLGEDCRIGIEVSVPIGQHEDINWELVYAKMGNGWRIGVASAEYDIKNRPWSDCGRDLKLWSVQHLLTLIKAIESAVDARIHIAEGALVTVGRAKGGA